MLEFWRLDTEDNFFLVEAPPLASSAIIRAYHLELLLRVKNLDNYWLVELDQILFSNLGNYYQNISKYLNPKFDCFYLTPESRHRFFIASEPRGDVWISGLELLMGYDFQLNEVEKPLAVTSGNYEIDILADLIISIPNQIKYLSENKTPQYLSKLLKQISDRTRGKEAIEELQRQKDLEICNSLTTEEINFLIPNI